MSEDGFKKGVNPWPRTAVRTRLVDWRVFTHEGKGHRVYVRGRFPHRVWRCARHDCDWMFEERADKEPGE